MILSFIDESGTGLKDRRTAFFVLAALSINASESQAMEVNLATLKRRLVGWARPEDFEIKGRELRRGEKYYKALS